MAPVVALLKEAEQNLNTDRKLAESYGKAGNVLLPMLFQLGAPRGKPDKPLPDFVPEERHQGAGQRRFPAAADARGAAADRHDRQGRRGARPPERLPGRRRRRAHRAAGARSTTTSSTRRCR